MIGHAIYDVHILICIWIRGLCFVGFNWFVDFVCWFDFGCEYVFIFWIQLISMTFGYQISCTRFFIKCDRDSVSYKYYSVPQDTPVLIYDSFREHFKWKLTVGNNACSMKSCFSVLFYRMKIIMDCSDRSRWCSVVSTYPHGKKVWVYVCRLGMSDSTDCDCTVSLYCLMTGLPAGAIVLS